jgi:hypothetical protein
MAAILTKPCRKCGTDNPVENVYCKKCGAVLGVATSVVRAQRAPLSIASTGIRRRYILLGVPMMVGITAVIIGVTAVLGLQTMLSRSGTEKGLLNSALMAVVLFVVSFFPSGLLLARMTRRSVVKEAMIASVLAVLLLGVLGSAVTTDLLIAACVALVPSVGAAWLGARIGGLGNGTEESK